MVLDLGLFEDADCECHLGYVLVFLVLDLCLEGEVARSLAGSSLLLGDCAVDVD